MEKKTYFKGLNGIRAIAAVIVLISHIDQYAYLFNIEADGFHKNWIAGNGVDLFFVLSGFLITYLLTKEKAKINTVDVKRFYIRRILRIWPLYYLTFGFSLLFIYLQIIPNVPYLKNSIILYTCMAPNLAYALYLVLPTAIPLWSVGVEEQFYLIWPHIAKFFKDLLTPLIALFFLFQGVKTYAFYQYEANSPINFMISLSRFNIIFIGAFGALMYASKSKILQVIYRKEVQIIAWIVLLGSIIFTSIHIHPLIDHEINAVFYLIIILNIATNPKTLIQLENKLFNAIGKISYGIYVYHMLILYALAIAIEKWSITLNYPLLYLLIPIATLCVSWLSYTFFETPILKYKKKFAIIKT